MNEHTDRGQINAKQELFRFISYWKLFLTSVIISFLFGMLYLNYAEYQYSSNTVIEIIDPAQDSEMALPTAMTIFNRSMVNLENEIGRLNSYRINRKVVSSNKANVKYYSVGDIRTNEKHSSQFFEKYKLEFLTNTDLVQNKLVFDFKFDDTGFQIYEYDGEMNLVKKYDFNGYSTFNINHSLPFNFEVDFNSLNNDQLENRRLIFHPFEEVVYLFQSLLVVDQTTNKTSNYTNSDQLILSLKYHNPQIANDYLNTLVNEFDIDGIYDRQLEYKRTIEFVDERKVFLLKELELIENQKKEYKESNNLSEISNDASVNIEQQFNYDSELFEAKSQLDLLDLLRNELEEKNKLLPVNFGLNNSAINDLITQYNLLISDRDRFLSTGAGLNNIYIRNINSQIDKFYSNILSSVDNYSTSLNLSMEKLTLKEKEFESQFKSIPEYEKILRSIDRELEVKEALYLLLLQKKEEASINFAVVKPTLKIIDKARNTPFPISPKKTQTLILCVFLGLFIPFIALSLIFYLDNKVHIREDLVKYDIPILSEVPFIAEAKNNDDFSALEMIDKNPRGSYAESLRMIEANLNYRLDKNSKLSNILLVTSSVKGEGKTLISVGLSKILSLRNESKVLLIGADLRNPQIHKHLNVKKEKSGLSDYLFRKNLNWRDLIIKHQDLDILISGSIPPNPKELLESDRFASLMHDAKKEYDFIVIDSAPFLLVADTIQLNKFIDQSIYVVRSNYTTKEIAKTIDDFNKQGKIVSANLVLNSVGISSLYGYGYGYGYSYSYNYGYGYSYNQDSDE